MKWVLHQNSCICVAEVWLKVKFWDMEPSAGWAARLTAGVSQGMRFLGQHQIVAPLGVWQADSLIFPGQQLHKVFRYFWNMLSKIFRKRSENKVSAQEILSLFWGALCSSSLAAFVVASVRIVQKANGKSCKWCDSGCYCKRFQRMALV